MSFCKIVLPLNFIIVLENLLLISSLVTDIQNFGENVCSILYDINLFEIYDQYEKKFITKTILVLDFTPVYQILSNLFSKKNNSGLMGCTRCTR